MPFAWDDYAGKLPQSAAVKLWSSGACFTRPEHKIERVSYPVLTPSAARGALSAIYAKPQFEYEILAIDVVDLGRFIEVGRNEVQLGEVRDVNPHVPSEERAQRTNRILADVTYIVHVRMHLVHAKHTDPSKPANIRKHINTLKARVERGDSFHTPYLGLREHSCYFAPAGVDDRPDISVNGDLGQVLLDFDYSRQPRRPEFFAAAPVAGRIMVPRPKWLIALLGGDR